MKTCGIAERLPTANQCPEQPNAADAPLLGLNSSAAAELCPAKSCIGS